MEIVDPLYIIICFVKITLQYLQNETFKILDEQYHETEVQFFSSLSLHTHLISEKGLLWRSLPFPLYAYAYGLYLCVCVI